MAPVAHDFRANATGPPQIPQQYTGTDGGCGSESCGTNLAAALRGAPEGQINGHAMTETEMAQQNSPAGDAGDYGHQKTCPVSGEALQSMGPPVPVSVKGQTIYVCCAGCVEAVQNEPDIYLAKVMGERAEQQ